MQWQIKLPPKTLTHNSELLLKYLIHYLQVMVFIVEINYPFLPLINETYQKKQPYEDQLSSSTNHIVL